MRNKLYLAALLFQLPGLIFCQDTVEVKKYLLGDHEIVIHNGCYSKCDLPVSFINLHNNENTSVDAAIFYMEYFGGNLMQLEHAYGRNICFNINGKGHTFDPNRIFTPVGLKATLNRFGNYSPGADTMITEFGDYLLRTFVAGKQLLVALHNNTDSQFSILSYTKGKSEQTNALKVYINKAMDPDDFVYTTEQNIYDTLVMKKINVVLQNNETVRDDGSLSVYASRNNIPYINVEAEEGHLDEQIRMLEALMNIINDYSAIKK